jgi:hypothetical protein
LVADACASKHLFGFARLDGSHRIRDAVIFEAMGLLPGTRASVSVSEGRAVVLLDERGTHAVDARGRLVVGDSVRKALGLLSTSGILLSLSLDSLSLTLVPESALERIVA